MHPDELIRTVLARLLFIGDEIFKKVGILSGGERVKVAFAKVFLSDMNVLIMDEPTNFLDIQGIEALEYLLSHYKGTVLFVSHDRRFVEKLADHILEIKNQTIVSFAGTYQEYRENKQTPNRDFREEELLVVETKLTEIISKLSEQHSDELEKKFASLIAQRNQLRNSVHESI